MYFVMAGGYFVWGTTTRNDQKKDQPYGSFFNYVGKTSQLVGTGFSDLTVKEFLHTNVNQWQVGWQYWANLGQRSYRTAPEQPLNSMKGDEKYPMHVRCIYFRI